MKLTVQYANNKFINNLAYTEIDNIQIEMVNIHGILYQSYYSNMYTHMIFVESEITNEILQFISEFFQKIKTGHELRKIERGGV